MPTVNKQTRTGRSKRINSIVGGITSVDDQPESGIKSLIFGQSGTGKTTLASTFPKPALLIRPEQVEDGSRSVRKVKGLDVTPHLTHCKQLDEIIEYQGNEQKYKSLILDGVGKFQDLVVKMVGDLHDTPAQLSWGIISQSDWGVVSNEFKQFLRNLLRLAELGTNLVVLGGERLFEPSNESSDLGLTPGVMIALQPATSGWCHEVCDYNVHTFRQQKQRTVEVTIKGKKHSQLQPAKGVDYCLHVGPHSIYATKFRVPRGTDLPDVMTDPSYDKLKAYIDGETPSNKPTKRKRS